MAFYEEPTGYDKTALSDLQGAWQNLREAAVTSLPFPEAERLLFHIDEGMSWENVRNLDNMRRVLLLIRNIALQSAAPEDVQRWIEIVQENLEEVLQAIKEGEAL